MKLSWMILLTLSFSLSAFAEVNPLHTARSLVLEGEALYMKFQNQKSFEKFEQAYHILKETGLSEESVKKYYQEIIMRLLSMEIQNTTQEERYKHFCDLFWSDLNLIFDDLFLSPNLQNEFQLAKTRYQKELSLQEKSSAKKLDVKEIDLFPKTVQSSDSAIPYTKKFDVKDMKLSPVLPWYQQKWFYYSVAVVLSAGFGGTTYWFYQNSREPNKSTAF